jgi:hypothetical protein
MQKETSLYIPTPCHEDWNKMTPIAQGKFCGSCSKQVVDFSLMSDQQILNFLSHQSGKLCGRFDAEQLQRPLRETKIEKKKSWWMALTMPLLFLFDRSEAQDNIRVQGDTIIAPIEPRQELMGKLIYHPIKEITIAGKIVDENNEPVPFATIAQKSTPNAVAANEEGKFTIQISSDEASITLVVSSVGYEAAEKIIDIKSENEHHINVTIITAKAISGEVVMVAGGLVASVPVKKIDTIKTAVKKIFNISPFKIYPNPVAKGSEVHLEIKQSGEYQLQLLDNQSHLIKAEDINAVSDKSSTAFMLPANIVTGIYYLRLIDERKKKQYTEKLIIQ